MFSYDCLKFKYPRYIRYICPAGILLSDLFISRGRYLLICLCMPVSCIFYSICFGYTGSGSLFLYFFSAKHLRGLYILGGICGGLLYMVAYNVFPLFSSQVTGATLVGASASVLAIVAATAYREPNHRVQLFSFRCCPSQISRTGRYRN